MKIPHRLLSLAALLGPGFIQPVDASLILGLDARDITQADGSAVENWTSTASDGVGSAAQPTALFQPIYRAASANLGGMPAVSFNFSATPVADGQGMTTNVSGLGTNYSILSLYAYRGDPGFARVVNGGNGTRHAAGAAGANNWLIGPYNGIHQLFDGDFISSGSTVTTPVIATALGSAAANNEFFLNGALAGSNGNNNPPNFVGLGTEGAFAETANSDIGLVLVFDTRLTADERIGVEFYMAEAYGLAGFSATQEQLVAGSAALGGFLAPGPRAPTDITLDPNGFLATLAVGGEVGTLTSKDINPFDTHSYALVAGAGDADNARFKISGDRLQTDSSFIADGGGTFSVRIESTDSDLLSFAKAITVNVVGDSDADELPDSWELMFTPLLGNLTGLAIGPGPGAGTGDFDGDGSSDKNELNKDTNPADEDSDDDGLGDGAEEIAGTNPLIADTDGDTLDDGDEVNGVPPTNPTLRDTDADGFEDNVELTSGTDPTDPLSFPGSNATLILGLAARDIAQADGTAVASWTSTGRGGVGSAMQATALFQPIYREASANLNGMPAVDFNFSTTPVVDGQGMTTSVSGLGTDYSILSLYAYRGDPGFARVVNGGNGTRHAAGGAGPNNWLLGPYNGVHQLYDGNFISSGSNVTTPVIATALGSADANNEFFLNGVLAGSNTNNNQPNFVGLGTEGAFAETANSDVGLVLVFDSRLTENERAGVEFYMAQEYGLEGFDATPGEQLAGATVLNGFLTTGTAPFIITSVLRFDEIIDDVPQPVTEIEFNSIPGRNYAVDFSFDLITWFEATDSVPSAGTSTVYTDRDQAVQAMPSVYYRVRVPPN